MDLSSVYGERVPILRTVANDIEKLLHESFEELPHVDAICTRVKDIDSFIKKASKKDDDDNPKYGHPLEEIQDQIGARIIVFYKSDVEPVSKKILAEFREVEDEIVKQRKPDIFSYEARHFVCLIPPDIKAAHKSPIDFFELQVSTLFQHAWAQANHDLGYKSLQDLSFDDKKKIAWAAAQAWGAEVIFDELWDQYDKD